MSGRTFAGIRFRNIALHCHRQHLSHSRVLFIITEGILFFPF